MNELRKPYGYLKNGLKSFKIIWNYLVFINFIFVKDAEEERVMLSKRNIIKSTSYKDASEVVDELFKSLNSRYQGNLETSNGKSDFISDSIQLLYYKRHRINFRCGGSYIHSQNLMNKWKKQQYFRQKKMINVFNAR